MSKALIGFIYLSIASAFYNHATFAKSSVANTPFSSSSSLPPSFTNFPNYKNLSKKTYAFLFSNKKQSNENNPFKTWTFDEACDTMDWNTLPNCSLSIQSPPLDSDIESSDLVIFGIYADSSSSPDEAKGLENDSTDDGEEEEEAGDDYQNDEDDKMNDSTSDSKKGPDTKLTLEGKVKEIDESLKGVLTAFIEENAKAFKNASVFGAATPTLRIPSFGEDGAAQKVSY